MLETSRVEAPGIRYTQSGDVSIAYAINGEGPIDVVFVHGYMSNLEVEMGGSGPRRVLYEARFRRTVDPFRSPRLGPL